MPFPYSLTAEVEATPDQLSTTLGDDVVILGLRDTVYYGLSGVGTTVWELLQTRRSINDIVTRLSDAYDVAPQRAAGDVQELLADLESHGLVRIDDPQASQV